MEVEIQPKRCSVPKVSFVSDTLANLALFVAHAWRVWGINFQEHPSNGSRDTDDEAQGSSSKVPLIIDRSQPNLHRL